MSGKTTNIMRVRLGTEKSIAKMLAKTFLNGYLHGIAVAMCEEGEEPEEITTKMVDEAYEQKGDALMKKYLAELQRIGDDDDT